MKKLLLSIPLVLMMVGCANLDIKSAKHPELNKQSSWSVLPFANNTETPMANDRAASMAAAILQADGETVVGSLPNGTRTQELLGGDWKKRYEEALRSAHNTGANYALSGSVDEWNYRAGINAKAAVSLTLWIVDVHSDKIIWRGVANASGGDFSQASTSNLAQRIINRLIDRALDR